MWCARALPIHPLMPAVGSSNSPVATLTPVLGGLPAKIERSHLFGEARTSGIPSIIMSPDLRPWTQIRLGADTRAMQHILSREEQPDDLTPNVFAPPPPAQLCGGSSSASRSFFLAALRALHLDPACGPPP